MRKIIILFTLVFLIPRHRAAAQAAPDTTLLSLSGAEKIFLQKNLSLLAANYNIELNKALIEQAKLWDNPVLSTDQNIYDGAKGDGKFFQHTDSRGQVFVQVTQLIKTAGKRSKLAQLATDNTNLASAQFSDIMRSLRYTLRSDLVEIRHQLNIKKIYDTEINELLPLINGMDAQLKAGNIALKDNLRVKALLFNLQNELVNIQAAIIAPESELKLLLQSTDSNFIMPDIEYQQTTTISDLPTLDSLIRSAIESRPDARIARTATDYQNHNLIYQKALAKPDITIGTEYDQHSSYNPNYVGLTIGLPINIFNRNQGNIKSAQLGVKQQEALTGYQFSKIASEVTASLNKLKFFQGVNNGQQLDFAKKYDDLFLNMLKSYQARQIGLLEFLDFADAYKDTKLKLLDQQNSLLKAVEELNYTTNSNIKNLP